MDEHGEVTVEWCGLLPQELPRVIVFFAQEGIEDRGMSNEPWPSWIESALVSVVGARDAVSPPGSDNNHLELS